MVNPLISDKFLRENFVDEVRKSNGGFVVWDPVRQDYCTLAVRDGQLYIRPTQNEEYPITIEDAADNRLKYIKKEYD
jgi:hypothetical protein